MHKIMTAILIAIVTAAAFAMATAVNIFIIGTAYAASNCSQDGLGLNQQGHVTGNPRQCNGFGISDTPRSCNSPRSGFDQNHNGFNLCIDRGFP
jgi:hypothetical protein